MAGPSGDGGVARYGGLRPHIRELYELAVFSLVMRLHVRRRLHQNQLLRLPDRLATYLHANADGHTAAASFAGTPRQPLQRGCAELDCSLTRGEASDTIHRRCPLRSWLAPAFYRKAVDQTPKVGVNFLDDAKHAQAEHDIQLGPGGRPVPYGPANTITPTTVVRDGAHVKQQARTFDLPISLHPGLVEDKLVFLEAGGTDQGSLALHQRPGLLKLSFSGNPAGLSAVRVGDVELERHASGARGRFDHDLRGRRKRVT
jgi:hypothetical protein